MYKNNIKSVILHILFKSNNILCTVTTIKGSTLFWISAGSKKYCGAKKITLTVIISMLKTILEYFIKLKIKNIHINLNGFNKHKRVVLKYFKYSFINILSITNNTKFPHNGCKNLKKQYI
uniref:Ribosomal protein S11 n=1 Tax=Gracilaria edulis TaxID=172966 RepID=A0A2S1PUM5_9FLOR|nr:ribosomal protein S11 [Gracilaria edulis]AWH62522.1 ribosomal protein S11 [Gracilaria edulis]